MVTTLPQAEEQLDCAGSSYPLGKAARESRASDACTLGAHCATVLAAVS